MCGFRRFLSVLGLLSALVIVAACGGDDGGGGEDAASGTDDGGSSGGCPSAVFEGEMSRDADPQQTEHEPVELTGDDIARIVAWIDSLPAHVNINDIEVMPARQANAYLTCRKPVAAKQ